MSEEPHRGLSFSTWPPGAFDRLTLIVEAFSDVSAPLTQDDMVRLRSLVRRTELPDAPDADVETLLRDVLDGLDASVTPLVAPRSEPVMAEQDELLEFLEEDELREYLQEQEEDELRAYVEEANRRAAAGDLEGAVSVYLQLIPTLERVLGPDILDVRLNLALWQAQAGDPAGALIIGTELLRDLDRVYGPDDPDTLRTRRNLAFWQAQAGDPAGALIIGTELLRDLEQAHGPDHPETLAARQNLARLHLFARVHAIKNGERVPEWECMPLLDMVITILPADPDLAHAIHALWQVPELGDEDLNP